MTSVRLPASWYLVGQSCVLMNWRHGLRVSEGQGNIQMYITHKMELGDIYMTAFMLYAEIVCTCKLHSYFKMHCID